jgi:hypothetical protein
MIGRKSLLRIAFVVAIIMVAVPALALGVSLDGNRTVIQSVTLDGCRLNINISFQDVATYNVRVVDNLVTMYNQDFPQGAAPGSFTAQYVIEAPPNNLGAIGIAIVVRKNGAIVSVLDLFVYSDDLGNTCFLQAQAARTNAACNSVAWIPAGSVVGDLPFGGRAYWEPGKITPDVFIKPGTYWVVDAFRDADGQDWYQIYLSCQYLWVPAEWMGPTFDGPWNGEPLPSPSNLSAADLAEIAAAQAAN